MSHPEKIPFLDLLKVHQELREELCAVFESALATGGFVGGPMVEAFERDWARFCGTEHAVGVASGTDALRLAFIAAGVRPGDVVVTVPNTFIATAEAISQVGGRPDFVDVDESTCTMDPEKLREYFERECAPSGPAGRLVHKRLGRPVTAVVPVHLYGQPADMDPIQDFAERYNVLLIEDACQAHGAEYYSRRDQRWKKAGSMGKAAAFSFYPGKNLGACGEGGAVTTDDLELAQKVRMLRDHGQASKYYHEMEGCNGRLDAIQAGILRVKLTHLSTWNEQRRQAAARYRDLFAATEEEGVVLPCEPPWAKSVYHLYVVRVPERDNLQKHLNEANVGTGIHYPIPLHLQKAYARLGYAEGCFPVAEKLAPEILSLPMFPGIDPVQQNRVVERVVASFPVATSRAA